MIINNGHFSNHVFMISCKETCFSPLFIKYDPMNSIKYIDKESMLALYAMMKIREIIDREARTNTIKPVYKGT